MTRRRILHPVFAQHNGRAHWYCDGCRSAVALVPTPDQEIPLPFLSEPEHPSCRSTTALLVYACMPAPSQFKGVHVAVKVIKIAEMDVDVTVYCPADGLLALPVAEVVAVVDELEREGSAHPRNSITRSIEAHR